jgi:hypothetical protein
MRDFRDPSEDSLANSSRHIHLGRACLPTPPPGRTKTNDYSVPVSHGHRNVWTLGYVDEVVIGCGGEVVARHPRCYDREDMNFDAVHYLHARRAGEVACLAGGAPAEAHLCPFKCGAQEVVVASASLDDDPGAFLSSTLRATLRSRVRLPCA